MTRENVVKTEPGFPRGLTAKWQTLLLALILGLGGGLFLFLLPLHVPATLGGFRVEVGVHWAAQGGTTLRLPPVGEISAKTHSLPVNLEVTLLEVNSQGVQTVMSNARGAGGGMVQSMGAGVRSLAWELILVFGAGAAFAGGVLGGLFSRRTKYLPVASGLTAFLLAAGLLVMIAFQYDPAGFHKPEYRGLVQAAPWMLNLAEKGLAQLDDLGRQLQIAGDNLSMTLNRLEAGDNNLDVEGDLRLLHVSDLHNNPAAVQLVSQVVKNFQVDAVIDTGDLTDFGTEVEVKLLQGLGRLGVPYYFVPGNHDHRSLLSAARRFPNFRLLDGEIRLKGLRIYGLPDPAFMENRGPSENEADRGKLGDEMIAGFTPSGPPDVLAVHHPEIAAKAVGTVPVILHGHTHKMSLEVQKGSVVIDAGTTGAAGFRGLVSEEVPDYSLAMLYFRRVESEKGDLYTLRAVDTIRMDSRHNTFLLERTFLVPGE